MDGRSTRNSARIGAAPHAINGMPVSWINENLASDDSRQIQAAQKSFID
jgi:hypothetical protein